MSRIIVPHGVATKKKRSNKWERNSPEFQALSPLGKRLAQLFLKRDESPTSFSRVALGTETRGGNLSTQLERLKTDDPDAGPKLHQLVKYARYGRVSLHWLITGEGHEQMGPYGTIGEDDEMSAMPEGLQRATRALVELEECSLTIAMDAAYIAYHETRGAPPKTTREWLAEVEVAYRRLRAGSGIRPSSRLPPKGKP